MNWDRWNLRLSWGLLAAIVALHAMIFCWREDGMRPNFWLVAAHDAQLLTATALIIGWVVLGPGRLWVRGAASPVLVWLWFLPANAAMQPREMAPSTIGLYFCATALFVCSLRIFGRQIVKRPDTLAREQGAQFSLRALLLATTLVAVAVGSLEWLRPTLSRLDVDSVFWSKRPTQFWRAASETRQLIMTAAIALTSVGAIVAVMGRGRIGLRIAALAITIPAAALYLAHVSGAGNHLIGLTGQTRLSSTAVALAAGLAAIAMMCCLSVLPLRLAGYRLQRPQGAPAFTESGIPTSWTYQQRLVEQAIAMSLVLGVTIAFGLYQIVRSRPRDIDFALIAAYSGGVAFDRPIDRIQPPLNAFAQWISDGKVDPWDERIYRTGTGTTRYWSVPNGSYKFLIDSQATIEPAETPLLPPTPEQRQRIQAELQK